MEKSTFKAHIDFRGSVPLRLLDPDSTPSAASHLITVAHVHLCGTCLCESDIIACFHKAQLYSLHKPLAKTLSTILPCGCHSIVWCLYEENKHKKSQEKDIDFLFS